MRDIDLAIIPPDLPFQKIIEYRYDHEKQLDEVRKELGNLARTIKETPWSKEFAEKIETDIIPNKIYPYLVKCKESRQKWLHKHRTELIQIGATAASMTLTIIAGAPLPIPELVTGGSTLLTSGLDMAKDEDLYNGFHYLMKIK